MVRSSTLQLPTECKRITQQTSPRLYVPPSRVIALTFGEEHCTAISAKHREGLSANVTTNKSTERRRVTYLSTAGERNIPWNAPMSTCVD